MDLPVRTCDALGLRPRRYERRVRLDRREDVRALVDRVGLKG
jgi:hypothetical protein